MLTPHAIPWLPCGPAASGAAIQRALSKRLTESDVLTTHREACYNNSGEFADGVRLRMRVVSMRWWATAGSMARYSVTDNKKRSRRNIAEARNGGASFALGGLAWVQRS